MLSQGKGNRYRADALTFGNVRGFSLIELAIVTFISSIILSGMLYMYKLYITEEFLTQSRQKQALIEAAISSYQARSTISGGALPCPSDPSLSIGNAKAGVADCSLIGSASGTCTAGGGLCIVDGFRDTAADADGALDLVLIGGVPYKTLGSVFVDDGFGTMVLSSGGVKDEVSADLTLDPWGYQMTYAVSAYLTNPTTNKAVHGAIHMQTELGTPITDPPGSAHFVLVAHGPNHAGAYTSGGIMATACDLALAEGENCDRTDAVFVRGLRTLVPGANYYDDTVRDRSFSISKLWEFVDGTTDIFNLNIGNVGVGTLNPLERLHVVGDLRSTKISQNMLCDTADANCWSPNNLGSVAGTKCPPAVTPGNISVVTGVKGGKVACAEVAMVKILTTQTCAVPGEYVVGFDGFGNIICEP